MAFMIVILHVCVCVCVCVCVNWFSYFSNLTVNVFIVTAFPPAGWPHGWPKHVGYHCAYKYF